MNGGLGNQPHMIVILNDECDEFDMVLKYGIA